MIDCFKSLIFYIFSIISICFFNTLFIETISSWIILESIKSLEIKNSSLFNLGFANNTVLYFLIPLVITQVFNCTTKAIAELETHPVT